MRARLAECVQYDNASRPHQGQEQYRLSKECVSKRSTPG